MKKSLIVMIVITYLAMVGVLTRSEGRVESDIEKQENLKQHIGSIALLQGTDHLNNTLMYLDEDGDTHSIDLSTMPYVDAIGFEYLSGIFKDIEFIVEFNEIEDDTRELFLSNYYRFLMGEAAVYVSENVLGINKVDNLYIYDLFPAYRLAHPLELPFKYYFMDFDGTGEPLLGIIGNDVHFIKYIPEKDMFVLWYSTSSTWDFFIAPNRISCGGGGNPIQNFFVILAEDASIEMMIHFYSEGIAFNNNEWESLNLVSLPLSLNDICIPEHLEKQAIRFGNNPLMYFKVTLEQFDILRQDYDYLRINKPPEDNFYDLFKNQIQSDR